MSSKICFGHAWRVPSGENFRDHVEEVVSILEGTNKLQARESVAPETVQKAEEWLGVNPDNRPIYAYIGDLHPGLGNIGIIIARTWSKEQEDIQGVTRCDSGGFVGGFGDFNADTSEGATRRERLGQLNMLQNTPELSNWEDEFDAELTKSYNPPHAESYVHLKTPNTSDWEISDPRRVCLRQALDRQDEQNPPDRRLWVWEIRMLTPPSKEEYVAIIMSQRRQRDVEDLVLELPISSTKVIWEEASENGFDTSFESEGTRSLLRG